MKSGSLFTGIGGFDLGFAQAGIEPAWQCEIDKAARSVLARRFPGVPCYEDVKNVRRDNVSAVDLVCGGFPCQDVSVAGKRAGLAGERSGLWFEFRRIVDELKPQWVVVENVPGLLSSNGGADFAVILRGLVECGYGVAWRILDAQYFGVAQRRRRVFIVGSLGDGRAAEVLFEREGLFGNAPTRREPGQGVAGTIIKGAAIGRKPEAGPQYGETLTDGTVYTLNSTEVHAIAFNVFGGNKRKDRPEGGFYVNEAEQSKTLDGTGLSGEMAQGGTLAVASSGVRRLTPTECERLQGFPGGWTDGQSDSARYRQLGNAVAVLVIRWIGERITEAARES